MSGLWEGVREGCGTCTFWWAFDGTPNFGSCKRRPPVMVAVSNSDPWGKMVQSVEQHVPQTAEADWCGEYVRRHSTCSPQS